MIINKIEWLSVDAQEAMVTVCDGNYVFIVFCHPCLYKQGDNIQANIHSFGEGEIRKINIDTDCIINKNIDDCGYEIVAEVSDVNQRLVKVGEIVIELSLSLPKDIYYKDKIVFNPSRLDLY